MFKHTDTRPTPTKRTVQLMQEHSEAIYREAIGMVMHIAEIRAHEEAMRREDSEGEEWRARDKPSQEECFLAGVEITNVAVDSAFEMFIRVQNRIQMFEALIPGFPEVPEF